MQRLVDEARKMQQQITDWRRDLHRIPEIGLHLPATSEYLASLLRNWGLPVETEVADSGILATVGGGDSGGRTIAIRADMDGLPIEEQTGLPYASEHKGRMHACGHDAHMAMALGAARLLNELDCDLPGQVKMIFQPAEEGPGGAEPMIAQGALEAPEVDAIVGLHIGAVSDEISNGQVGIRSGPSMASSDSFSIEVRGKGGHGALPHTSVDPIAVSATVIQEIQSLISRELSPVRPGVLSICQIEGGTANNIIPEKVMMKGTARFLHEQQRDKISQRLVELVEQIGKARGADVTCEYRRGYPVLVNDPGFTDFFARCAGDIVGDDQIINLDEPIMGSEDMAYFLRLVPGTFFFLGGASIRGGEPIPHHHPEFDIDEDVLWIGSALLAKTAFDWLDQQAQR